MHIQRFKACQSIFSYVTIKQYTVVIIHWEFGKLWLMPVKLFILGLPGSGKSAMARQITKYVFEKYQWGTGHFNDYGILKTMSDYDTDRQFKSAEFGGFDVLDLTAFDIALRRLEEVVSITIKTEDLEKAEMLLVEFSRNDYQRAFRQFSRAFFQDAYFLHLDTDVEICKQRINDRIAHPVYEDDYPVSEYIFKKYYYNDDGQTLPQTFRKEYGIDESRVLVVDNNYPLEDIIKAGDTLKSIYKLIYSIIESRELSIVP
jgi:adenylate kinase family enzyme